MGAFKASYEGIGELLQSAEMQAEMGRRGSAVESAAMASAPVGTSDVHYKDSFELDVGVVHRKTARACATVRNSSDHAIWVEFGSQHNPRHRTLGKALDAAG